MSASPRHVLLVEDEPGTMTTVALLLEMLGHRVSRAANGKRALAMLLQERPDVVVTDYMMPHMNGLELIAAMKADAATLAASNDSLLKAAEELAKEGIEAEVVDLRTLRPLDHETIVESVKKTNRIVSVEEGWGPMGVGAEICARVIEHAFDYLDAPPLRVHQEDVPMPYAANLEALTLPTVEKIIQAVKKVTYASA